MAAAPLTPVEVAPPPHLPLDELYRRYGHLVVRRARRILGSEADARDVLHDLFLDLAQRPEQFRGESSFATFLYSRTTSACLDRLRTRRRRAGLLAAAEPTVGDAAPGVDGQAGVEDLIFVRALLRQLPEELAAAAIYHHVDGMTHAEIASLLGCSRRHVGNQLERVAEWATRARRTA